MKDKELRKLIGSRAKQRRLELNLTQPYVAEKMGVTASTILRYENGSIDNTKKMVLEGLSEALHVSIEWLRGETDEYETDITDKKELQIRDAMGDILKQLPLDLSKKEDAFSKDLLLLMLKQYNLFLESFQFACKNYKGSTNESDIAKVMGFESNDEYNEIMFLREITHTVNAFNDMADIVRLYSKKPEMAEQRLENLLSEGGGYVSAFRLSPDISFCSPNAPVCAVPVQAAFPLALFQLEAVQGFSVLPFWLTSFFENGYKKRPPTFRTLRPVNGLFFGIRLLYSVR